MDLIPSGEAARLAQAVVDAQQLAENDQVAEGYDLLDLMLSWAETPALDPATWEHAPPEPWADALIHGYRVALVAYCRRYQLTFPLPTSAPLTVQEHIAAALARSRQLRAVSVALQSRSRALRRKAHRRSLPL